MAVKDYNTDPDLNTTISGINIAEGCPPSGINDAIRQLMADVKEESEAIINQASIRAEAQAAKDAEQDAALATTNSNLATTNSNLAALDAAVVHKTGDEEIEGTKTFSSSPHVRAAEPFLFTSIAGLSIGTNPAKAVFGGIRVFDKDGKYIGQLRTRVQTSGTVDTGLVAYSLDGSKNAQMNVWYPATGDSYATAPSTPEGSTGNQIVTADYLNSTGTYSPTNLPYIDLERTSDYPYENNLDNLRKPGIYHVRWNSTALGVPIATTADAIVEVRRISSASSVSSYARLFQIVHITGPGANVGRTFYRRTGTTAAGTFESWVEAMTSKGGTFTSAIKAPTPAATSSDTTVATTAWVRGKGVLIESWHDENGNWYRKYSDGWIEQGGSVELTYEDSGSHTQTVNLYASMTTTNYQFLTGFMAQSHYDDEYATRVTQKTKTNVSIEVTDVFAQSVDWYVCGF